MKPVASALAKVPSKAPTGILGFDEITGGGFPRGRTTLLVGGPGSGKTIFALQFLVHGARACNEPGIFVAFEESSSRIVANAESFGWKLPELQQKTLVFMDAQPMPDLVQSGDFDLGGMLAALEVQIKAKKAQRIVFDALDVVLALLADPAAKRREIYRLHEWLLARELTGLITAKAGGDEASSIIAQPFGFMQFMVDCAVKRLDTMPGGGYYRGASVLITGFPGTAKTTLSGAFAEAACQRGEHTLFVSFDSDCSEVIRALKLKVVAEGVKTKEQSSLLRLLGCD